MTGSWAAVGDPEWKYVNVRRLALFLERSIDEGTQWAAFEPNGEALWSEVRRSAEGFLFSLYRAGAFEGSRPEDAYFVRCDRTTMTQDDIDNGRLIILVGFAPVRPAEFIVLRID
jgi:phage tail sheath protein FI